MTNKRTGKDSRERLVETTTARLREIILSNEPNIYIGSLRDVAKTLGVGIVTLQQVARILEHEGFLEVRRGHSGGYYGARPNEVSLERSMSGYLLVHRANAHYHESIDIMTLLDCQLMPAAASSRKEALHEELRLLAESIDRCDTSAQRVAFEKQMHNILFRMVDRPLTELIARVTMRHHTEHPTPTLYVGEEGVLAWKDQRQAIVRAILKHDPNLARFEAERRRSYILERLNEGYE